MERIEQIWSAARTGSAEEWAALVRMLSPVVYSTARRWGLSIADAEDISQQTWMVLYDKRDQIEDPLALPAWLVRVASRKAHRRNLKRARETGLPSQEEPVSASLPDEDLLTLERNGQLRMALTQLDERCRRLVTELFLSDPRKSYEQIALELGLKPNSLGPIRARCLKKLRTILEGLDD